MEKLEVIRLELSALPGTSLGEALQEGLRYAVTEWRNVNIVHNGKCQKIIINDLLGAIVEQEL